MNQVITNIPVCPKWNKKPNHNLHVRNLAVGSSLHVLWACNLYSYDSLWAGFTMCLGQNFAGAVGCLCLPILEIVTDSYHYFRFCFRTTRLLLFVGLCVLNSSLQASCSVPGNTSWCFQLQKQ